MSEKQDLGTDVMNFNGVLASSANWSDVMKLFELIWATTSRTR